jgi:hypothetical protein
VVDEAQNPLSGTRHWSAVGRRDKYRDEIVAALDRVADRARAGDWDGLLAVLQAPGDSGPEPVNTPRVGSTSGFASLHQAAWHGADRDVVERLLDLGAWRTLRAADGRRPIDIARARGHRHLDDLLEPPAPDGAARPGDLDAVECYLHALVTVRSRSFGVDGPLRLPQVGPLWEIDADSLIWCPIPGMYGGFSLHRDDAELVAESWCRIVGGSGQEHRITPDEVRLVRQFD